jgi:hypothetical protein
VQNTPEYLSQAADTEIYAPTDLSREEKEKMTMKFANDELQNKGGLKKFNEAEEPAVESYTLSELNEAFSTVGLDTSKYTTEYLADQFGLQPLDEGKVGDAMRWGWNKVVAPTAKWTWKNVARPVGRFAKDTAIGATDAVYQAGRGLVKGGAELAKGTWNTGVKAGSKLAAGLGDTGMRVGRELTNTNRMNDLTLRDDGSIGPGKMGFMARTGRNIFNAGGQLVAGLAKTGLKTGAELAKGAAETGLKTGAELAKGAANAAVAQGKGIGRGVYSAATNKAADYKDLYKPVMESYTREELSQLFEQMNLETEKYTFDYLAEQLGFEKEE